MKIIIVLLILSTNVVYAGDCCYISKLQSNNKVEILTRVVGIQQPIKSRITLEQQFELQRLSDSTIEPYLNQGQTPIPLRIFTFAKNVPDYIPKPKPVQLQVQNIQHQQSTQVFTGLIEAPVIIQNGKITIPSARIYGQGINYQSTVQNITTVNSPQVISIQPNRKFNRQ